MIDTLLRDLRHAARSLVSRPTYAVVTITTLALVVGAASAVLAVINATMVRPLPFPEGDRLVQLFLMPPGVGTVADRNPLSTGVFHRFRGGLRLVESIEGVWVRDRALGGDTEPESIAAATVSPGVFALFGGPPLMGRTFTEAEDQANAKVAVLSYALWQRRFGGDPGILGRAVLIDREAHDVIGVMPPSFQIAYTATDLWMPLNVTEAAVAAPSTFIQTFARLRPGVTVDQLRAELHPAMQAVVQELPNILTGWTALATTLRDAQFGQRRTSLLALLGGMLALVLIACANLANLTLAQIMSRRAEIALRTALGGGRAAIVRLQLCETLLIAVAGGVAGIVLGAWALPLLLALDPTTARTIGDVQIDWRVQLGTASLALLVALLSSVWPLLREVRGDLARGLADGNRRAAGSRRDERTRHLLVGAECAMTVMLLASGALLLSAFDRTSQVDPGFEPDGVLGAQLRLSATAYPTEAARAQVITRVLERVRGIPGVIAAASTLNQFVPGAAYVTLIHIEGKPTPDGQAHTVQFRRVSSEYFRTMRIPMLRGRDFSAADGLDTPLVAVVSRQLAERFWPGADPIGRRIRRGSPARVWTVVGVVDEVSDVGFSQAPAPTLYVTFTQNNVAITPVTLVVRTGGDPLALTHAVRSAVLSVDPAQPIDDVTSLTQFLADSLGPQRFRSVLLVLLAGLGLALAGVGIYGVTARAVQERTKELGVRLALGATPARVAWFVVWQAMRAVVAGLAAGVALAMVAGTMLIRTLPDLDRAEVWTTAPALLVLLIVATLTGAIPARRAVALDPTTALRADL